MVELADRLLLLTGGTSVSIEELATLLGGSLEGFTAAIEIGPGGVKMSVLRAASGSDDNLYVVLRPKGNGAFALTVPDGTGDGGNALGNYAVDLQLREPGKSSATEVSSGIHSYSEGIITTASGYGSHAEGNNVVASGYGSHAEGFSTTASGDVSHAEGSDVVASGSTSHAEGTNTTASGNYSHAEGNTTVASGDISHAEGLSTTASGNVSHAEGADTTASGSYSHAEGLNTIASGQVAHAEGSFTTASGQAAHAEGSSTTASGEVSHAEGSSTTASGEGSHTEGGGTTASGVASHAEGSSTTASGDSSHAEGSDTTASGEYSRSTGQGSDTKGLTAKEASAAGSFNLPGDAQIGRMVLSLDTVDATPIQMATGNGGALARVYAASIINHGNGDGTPGPVSLAGTTGTGDFWTGTGTVNSDGLLEDPIIITSRGVYSVSPAISDPVTASGTLTGVTCAVQIGGTLPLLPNNSTHGFKGRVVAREDDGTSSYWSFEGLIKRGIDAGTTALVATVTPTVVIQDAGAITWGVNVTADAALGGIAVTVTGETGKNIRWLCRLETEELIGPPPI